MSFGTESAPGQREAQRPTLPCRAGLFAKGRLLMATVAATGVLGLSAAGCGGGGGNPNPGGSPTPATETTITGTLQDGSGLVTPAGIGSATVSFNGKTTTTAANGTFTLHFTGAVPTGTMVFSPGTGTTAFQQVATVGSSCFDTGSGGSAQVQVPAVSANATLALGAIKVFLISTPPQPPCL